MLENVATKIGYKPPVLAEITAARIDALPAEFKDDFRYFFGRYFFEYKQMSKSIESRSSPEAL